MATTDNWYVDPNASGAGDGTSWTDAYTALQTAENAKDADITAATGTDKIVIFHCKSGSGTADAVTVVLGWTTAAGNYIKIQGGYAAGETGTPGTPEGLSSYSSDHYYVTTSDGTGLLVYENYVRVDKMQYGVTVTANNTGIGLNWAAQDSGDNDVRAENSIFNGVSMAGTGAGQGIRNHDADTIGVISNCVIYGFISGVDSGFRAISTNGATTDVYNTSIYNCYWGLQEGGAGTYTAKNCVVKDCSNDVNNTWSLSYCGTDDGDQSGSNGNFTITQAANVLWTAPSTGDFSVKDTSSELYDAGDDVVGYGDPDINNTARGATWDVGAFEFSSAGTNLQLNIGDDWKTVDGVQINIGDSWKTVAGMQINIGDSWKTIF